MNDLLEEELRQDFQDEDARYAYVEAFLNASVAAQIKKFRGDMSQQELADKIGTKQSGVSRLENVNYSSWKVETLRKLARAFGLRLRISFEEFGTMIPEIENFRKGVLERKKFEDDPVFNELERQPVAEEVAATSISDQLHQIANFPQLSIASEAAIATFAELGERMSRMQTELQARLNAPMEALNASLAETAKRLTEIGMTVHERLDFHLRPSNMTIIPGVVPSAQGGSYLADQEPRVRLLEIVNKKKHAKRTRRSAGPPDSSKQPRYKRRDKMAA